MVLTSKEAYAEAHAEAHAHEHKVARRACLHFWIMYRYQYRTAVLYSTSITGKKTPVLNGLPA